MGGMPRVDLAGGSVDGEIGRVLSSPLAAVLFGRVWQRAIWFVSACRLCQHRVGEPELILPRMGRGHCDLHAPHADAHEGADL